MKETLRAMTESFTANYKTLYKESGFQMISRHTATACAFLFTANKAAADVDLLKDNADIVKSDAPKMSYFKMEPNYVYSAAFLSLSNAPVRLIENTAETYEKLKKTHGGSQYLALEPVYTAIYSYPEQK